MKHDNAASWRATGSLACAKFVSKDIEHRDGAASGDPVPFRLPTGKFFDDALDIRDPEGTVLTNEIIALIAAIEQRRKKRRPVDASNHWILVRKILANGLRCHFHRRPPYVAYLRRTESYRTGPSWLNGRAIGHAVDLLASLIHDARFRVRSGHLLRLAVLRGRPASLAFVSPHSD
ncbi:hypothetical protein [Sphingobium cloacae]|uniref:hypothetical protein n=2 Tax=Sphingobium cloacae TaxID=120107 RepID=UPI0015CF8F6E|nr:hypothetical protein [Sphingobium cloacae]